MRSRIWRVVAWGCVPVAGMLSPSGVFANDCRDGAKFAARCETRLAQLKGEISSMISRPLCHEASECRTIGVGAKACGGPGAYVAYAPAALDEKQLLAKVQEYNRLNRLKAEAMGWVSDCRLVADPGATCISRQCMLRGTGNVPDRR